MEFKLPRLKTDVDCEPLGYSGLVFQFWLNPTTREEEWIAPDKRNPPVKNPRPWDLLWYNGYARVCLKITIPANLTDGGEKEVIGDVTAKAIYDLDHSPGFESSVLLWAFNTWNTERQERLQVAAKN